MLVAAPMMVNRTELRFRDYDGVSRVLTLNGGESQAGRAGILLSAHIQPLADGIVVRTTIANRSGASVRLDSVRFDVATGLPATAPARFFKHGYQSWSASGAVAVGATSHPRDGASPLSRATHQSEAIRPAEAPEAATSELFTLVESAASHERFLAGFIGGAHQLTTVTVKRPDQLSARALLDGATLAPGEIREVEPLACWRTEQSASLTAARWAAMLGDAMGARVSAPYRRGWCSWYYYFHEITEEALLSNLRVLKEMRTQYPLEVVQLDDGYQPALGDWDRTNFKFPSGLKKIADEIRNAGFIAGLWTAPFFATRDSHLMREHPDWFIRDGNGGPVRAGHNPKWTVGADEFAYALDATNPAFAEYLERLCGTLVGKFGYEYLKLDFLFAGAIEGIRFDPALTRAESLRRGLEAIRRGAGEKTFILGCGCPFGPAVGLVDGMRIGPDVAPYWGATGEPATALAIDAIVARSFTHRRLWLNDPDCLMLRAHGTRLSTDERQALAWSIAVSGGMLMISDDMRLLGEESAALFQAVARIGAEVDRATIDEPPFTPNLMDSSTLRILSVRARDSSTFHLLLNMGEDVCEVRLAEMLPPHTHASIVELEGEIGAADRVDLPPHSARIIRTR